ncbi:DegT/DnrJ/EryC1/StrS aminotransferase family protein [Kyrpidia sp.]|uniref:DegT/DnrJ/EryC1/StrS family aminotransferase n=1 Tax=Kyrpidia sp. TaxID=2073077 RepID=UPI0025885DE5|nr:DegT/DnrJ/EryC1/StrS aminotransferase family protein [Kyrpidia sp.]MCL6576106.1 DegT/DnrJ/EryC1/StrS aminotransferase family protein [Kyrpidia sp.]
MPRNSYLPFSAPTIGEDEIHEVVDTLRSDWLTTGPKTKLFETEFASFVGSPAALAVNSCTAGLHLALMSLGIGPGDEVITTPMTFAATVNVIEHVGARPVFVDVEEDTLNIDPEKVDGVLGPRSRAVLAVHYAGHPVNLDELYAAVKPLGIHLVQDAAHALPAKYKGRFIGSGTDLVSFSFYATKNMTTGEGGMLVGNPHYLEKARVISLHGMSRDAWRRYDKGGGWYYEVLTPGFKYNMTDIQAALGLWQLRRLHEFQSRRRQIVKAYHAAFSAEEALEVPVERPDVEHAWHLYVLRLHLDRLRIDRDRFIDELKARNIGTSVHFIPVHLHPYYRDKYHYKPEDYPVAYENYKRMVSLPLYPRMTDQDVADVVEAVLDVVDRYRR